MFDLEKYNFELDKKLIRTEPIIPADRARLLIYNTSTNTITHDIFSNISQHIPSTYSIYRNTTKVTPARIEATNIQSNKSLELLFMINEQPEQNRIRAMVNSKISIGDTLIITSKDEQDLESQDQVYAFQAVEQDKHIFTFKHSYGYEELLNMLQKFGTTPLPTYITKLSDNLTEDKKRLGYNSIFANQDGSIAAPTASLHFTKEVLSSLSLKGIRAFDLNLSIGLGTFAPLNPTNFMNRKLHQEYYFMPDVTAQSLSMPNPKLAIGTTTLRAIESWNSSNVINTWHSTDIFIFDNYQFRYVDALITNFHLPKSSLICLVDAFLAYKKSKRSIIDLYHVAIAHNYFFYSFGDAMLII